MTTSSLCTYANLKYAAIFVLLLGGFFQTYAVIHEGVEGTFHPLTYGLFTNFGNNLGNETVVYVATSLFAVGFGLYLLLLFAAVNELTETLRVVALTLLVLGALEHGFMAIGYSMELVKNGAEATSAVLPDDPVGSWIADKHYDARAAVALTAYYAVGLTGASFTLMWLYQEFGAAFSKYCCSISVTVNNDCEMARR